MKFREVITERQWRRDVGWLAYGHTVSNTIVDDLQVITLSLLRERGVTLRPATEENDCFYEVLYYNNEHEVVAGSGEWQTTLEDIDKIERR